MKWHKKLKDIDLVEVKNIAAKYGKDKLIAEKLGITINQLNQLRYKNKAIVHSEYRKLAIAFAIAIEEGVFEYKKKKLKQRLQQPY